MYKVIKAATEANLNPEYERFLEGDVNTFDSSDLAEGLKTLSKLEQDYEDEVFDDLEDAIDTKIFEDDDWNLDAAVTAVTISSVCGKSFQDIVNMRRNEDGDFTAVTFKDGTVKYYFDRGVMSQGIKDAETGKIYHFNYS